MAEQTHQEIKNKLDKKVDERRTADGANPSITVWTVNLHGDKYAAIYEDGDIQEAVKLAPDEFIECVKNTIGDEKR